MRPNFRILLFAALGLLITGFYVVLVLQNRFPLAHDTFQYCQLGYIYFNEIAWHGTVPFWFPYIEQGMVGNYFLNGQLMILSPVIYLLALFVKGINYLYIFYAGMWFDEMFFLLGVLLLGSVYYKRWEALFFVGLTILGSTIWYPQVFWGFHVMYFIPVVLFCFHRFLDTSFFRYLWGAVLFFFLGFIGNGIYINIFVAFVLFVYVASLILGSKEHRQQFFPFLCRVSLKQLLALVMLMVILAAGLYYVKFADGQIAYIGRSRTVDGTTLQAFLSYGGGIPWLKFMAFFSRDSLFRLTPDLTLYGGFFLPVFVVVGLWGAFRKKHWGLLVMTLTVILFSCGTAVSVFFYYVFPLGKVFRHIGLTTGVAKMLLIFVAGFGVERLLHYLDSGRFKNWLFWIVLTASVCFLLKGFDLQKFDYFLTLGIAENKILFFLRGLLLAGAALAAFYWFRADLRLKNRLCVLVLFAVIALELGAYKYAGIISLMPRVSPQTIRLLAPVDYSFSMTRQLITKNYYDLSPRARAFFDAMKGDKVKGALYDTTEAFLFTDSRSSIFRCDYISFPVGSLIMATTNPAKVVGNDRYLHYCRLSTPKLGVFSVLHDAADDHALGEALVRLPLDRRSLWTTQDQLGKIPFPVLSRLASVAGKNRMLADHEEIQADVTVKDFSFNELKLNVNVRGETGRPYLLYYADAYHPFWKAFVNGVESPVIRANIGYKATVIPSGRSEVVFRFGHPFFIISLFCLLLFCLGALIFSGYLFWKDVWLFKGPGI